MKKQHIIFSIAIYFVYSTIAIAQPVFQKHFSDLTEYQKLSNSPFDNSYIMASSIRDIDGLFDFCVVKMDLTGNIIWNKKFPSSNDDYLSSLYVTPSGDIFLAGHKLDGNGDFNFSVMKLNSAGSMQWYKTYGTTGLDMFPTIQPATNGDFFICGNRNGSAIPLIIKINSVGTILWNKTFGLTLVGNETTVLASNSTSDGGLVIFGEYKQQNYLRKINMDGTVAWTNYSNGASQYDYMGSIKQTSDGGYILIGRTPHCNPSVCTYNLAFTKFDNLGHISWSESVDYKYTSEGKDVIETSDSCFVFTGQLTDPSTSISKLVLIKVNNKGKHLFSKTYGDVDSNGEYANIEQASDGGFLLLGMENSNAYLIKTDAFGNANCNNQAINFVLVNIGKPTSSSITIPLINDVVKDNTPICIEETMTVTDKLLCISSSINHVFSSQFNYILYPNPFNDILTLEMPNYNSLRNHFEFNLYDMLGRKVIQVPMINHKTVIQRGNLPRGIYFYDIIDDEKIIGQGKVIAE